MNEKFLSRGKRKDNGEWVTGYYVPVGDKYHYICTGKLTITNNVPTFEHFYVIPETVGRCTGLTDKNGKLIFEGDIVEYDNVNYEIKYIEGFAAFDLRSVDNMNYAPRITTNTVPRMSVIGNIHDNPELIGGTV